MAAGDVVPLDEGRHREDDVGVAGGRRPERLVDDDRLGPLPGAGEAVEVLVVVERIAAGPVDEADVGIGVAIAVEVEGLPGLQEHVGDPRDRNERTDRVRALRQRRPGDRASRVADAVGAAVAEAEAAAGEADLAEKRGEGDQRPARLLAVVRPLERPRHHQEGPRPGHAAGERPDRPGRNLGERRRPVRRLGDPVGAAVEIGAETVEPDRVAVEEGAVVEALGDEGVGEREHQRHVAVRPHRKPFGPGLGDDVVAHRAHRDEVHAGPPAGEEPVPERVADHAPGGDLAVPPRRAAEHHDQPGMPGEHGPRGVAAGEAAPVADDVGQDDVGRGEAVVLDRAGIAADGVQEAVDLALRVVEAPGARPAVGAAVDRFVPVLRPHPVELRRGEVEGGVPRDADERLPPAPGTAGRAALPEEGFPDDGMEDAGRIGADVAERLDHRRGVRIARQRSEGGRAGGVPKHPVNSPVGCYGRVSRSGKRRLHRGRRLIRVHAMIALRRRQWKKRCCI